MLNSKIKTISKILMIMLLLSVIIALPTMAANHEDYADVAIENGKFVGVNEALGSHEYAYVTIEDYDFTNSCWSTSIDSSRFTTYDGSENLTENGVVLIRLKSEPEKSATFYVDGENYIERSEIGEIVTGTYTHVDMEMIDSFVTGKWTGVGAEASTSWTNSSYYRYSPQYYISETWCRLIDNTTRKNYFTALEEYNKAYEAWDNETHPIKKQAAKNTLDTKATELNGKQALLVAEFETARYLYAYQTHEILPVDELETIAYISGIRQGSLSATSPSGSSIMTKVIVWVLSPSGELVPYTWTDITGYTAKGGYTDHSFAIKNAFPTAVGAVMGLEFYPFGELPDDTTFSEASSYTSICLAFEFKPDGYTTKYKNENMVIPFQYNGENTSYIKGYADGTFKPDAKITKAEASTILARLLLSSEKMPKGYLSSFADVTVDAWYHDAVAFLEFTGAYDYISGTKLNPEEYITRGELAELIFSTAKLIAKDSKNVFGDVEDTNEYYNAIITLSDIGVINGYGDGTFRPDATVSRAEAVTMINRLINLVANDKTVEKSSLSNTFSDINGHWAEYQVLMASNDKVKTKAMRESSSTIASTADTITIETDHVKITIQKELARVIEILNKDNNSENVLSTTLTPWFASLVSANNILFNPIYADVVNGRLEIEFSNGDKAYFVVEELDNYFTITLDSALPFNTKYIDFGVLNVNCDFSNTDDDTYRLSAVAMTTTVNTINRPGGSAKKSIGRVVEAIGDDIIGSKMAVTFSRYGGLENGEHRTYLKEIQVAVDPAVGIKSTKGGAYTYDIGEEFEHYNDAIFYDYVIQSGGLSANTEAEISQLATQTAQLANKYSIEILDLHQGGIFRQGDFNFLSALTSTEKSNGVFGTGAMFKERISDKIHDEGVLTSLHTYSMGISTSAKDIVTNPKWQKQLAYNEENTLTLEVDMTTTGTSKDASMDVFEDCSEMTIPEGSSYSNKYTGYFLIDEEIVSCWAPSSRTPAEGKFSVTRGCFGTTKSEHKAGTKAYNLGSYYGCLQPEPGSELFYYIAELTGKACVEGGFDMIYLDGFEAMRHFLDDTNLQNYYYSEFIRVIFEAVTEAGGDIPMLEGSDHPVGMWVARGKSGAVDHATRQYKKYNLNHLSSNKSAVNNFQTSTLGWFHYAPDIESQYTNMTTKTLFRDDIDLLGTMSVAYNMSTVLQPFSVSSFNKYPQLVENWEYYNVYSRLREGFYFSDAVKEILKAGINEGKEYQIFDNDGKWAFREMYYSHNIVRDMADDKFITGKDTNSFDAQTPYIRIEQRYSALDNAEETVLVAQSKHNSTAGYYTPAVKNLSNIRAIKVNVTGNNSSTDGILISLKSSASSSADRIDHFIPLNFTGTREFILMDADNADYDGYSFDGFTTYNVNYQTYRNTPAVSSIGAIQISKTGNCTGVVIGDIRACALTDAPASNPSVTIADSEGNSCGTITFGTTLNSGEYIEYLPNEGKAYRNYYDVETYYDSNGKLCYRNLRKVEDITDYISITGSIEVPAGDFSYTYGGTSTTGAPLRAKVVIGLQSSEIIQNEDTWMAPEVVIPPEAIKLGAPIEVNE